MGPVSSQKAFSCRGERICLFEIVYLLHILLLFFGTSLKVKVNLEFLLTLKEDKY